MALQLTVINYNYKKGSNISYNQTIIGNVFNYLVTLQTLNGNILLNVGPTAEGIIPDQSVAILKRIGKWYSAVKESLENVETASLLTANRNLMLTRRENTLYVHLNKETAGNAVKLKPFNVAPVKATLLNDGGRIEFVVRFSPSDHQEQKAYLNLINLPLNDLCNTVPVIKLEFDRPIDKLIKPSVYEDGKSGWM